MDINGILDETFKYFAVLINYRCMVSARSGLRLLYIIEIRYHIAYIYIYILALRVVDTNFLGVKNIYWCNIFFIGIQRLSVAVARLVDLLEVLQGT